MQVVSVSGLIGAGKDTAANHLIQQRSFVRVSFSAALKDAVSAVFGMDRAMLEGDTPEARAAREAIDPWWSRELGYEASGRNILQRIGTEVMRDGFHPNIWVLAVKRRLDSMYKTANNGAVMSDARFFNELDMVYQMGGTTIRVIRDEPEWVTQFQTDTFSAVSTELGRPFAILNLGKEDIAIQVRHTATSVLKGMGLDIHQSEWEHLLWNKFVTVQNDSDLETLFRRINSVV